MRLSATAIALSICLVSGLFLVLVARSVADAQVSAPAVAVGIVPPPDERQLLEVVVTNLSHRSTVGARGIGFLILDCGHALGGQGLSIDEVFAIQPPPGKDASVTVINGVDADNDAGPAVLGFTGFGDRESTSFAIVPDNWSPRHFNVKREHLQGCVFQIVFSGRDELRGYGVLKLQDAESLRAVIRQQYPPVP